MLCILLISCSSKEKINGEGNDIVERLQQELVIVQGTLTQQEKAFEALNKLQLAIEDNHLYSTFSGIPHDCNNFDSTFVISNTQLRDAIITLLLNYESEIPKDQYGELADNAVLAQDKYLVKMCHGSSIELINGSFKDVSSATKPETWILPKVLDRRDIVIHW